MKIKLAYAKTLKLSNLAPARHPRNGEVFKVALEMQAPCQELVSVSKNKLSNPN